METWICAENREERASGQDGAVHAGLLELSDRPPTRLANCYRVIEGACRHLVTDTMDITRARWSLDGAEAVLKLRALISKGDFAEYWRCHLIRERLRAHDLRYADATIPKAA